MVLAALAIVFQGCAWVPELVLAAALLLVSTKYVVADTGCSGTTSIASAIKGTKPTSLITILSVASLLRLRSGQHESVQGPPRESLGRSPSRKQRKPLRPAQAKEWRLPMTAAAG